jgi:hypothetical protein
MAATLTEKRMAPAVQEITPAEFECFVKACQNPPVPIQKLQELPRSNFAGRGPAQTDDLGHRGLKASRWTSRR